MKHNYYMLIIRVDIYIHTNLIGFQDILVSDLLIINKKLFFLRQNSKLSF